MNKLRHYYNGKRIPGDVCPRCRARLIRTLGRWACQSKRCSASGEIVRQG